MADPLLNVPVPSVALPSLKVTVPVGVPEVPGVALPVNVTFGPCVDRFRELVTIVVVGAAFVVSVRAAEVLAR